MKFFKSFFSGKNLSNSSDDDDDITIAPIEARKRLFDEINQYYWIIHFEIFSCKTAYNKCNYDNEWIDNFVSKLKREYGKNVVRFVTEYFNIRSLRDRSVGMVLLKIDSEEKNTGFLKNIELTVKQNALIDNFIITNENNPSYDSEDEEDENDDTISWYEINGNPRFFNDVLTLLDFLLIDKTSVDYLDLKKQIGGYLLNEALLQYENSIKEDILQILQDKNMLSYYDKEMFLIKLVYYKFPIEDMEWVLSTYLSKNTSEYESLFNLDDNERNNEIERMIEFEGRFVLKYLVQSPRITVEYRLALTDLLSNLIKFQSKELYSIIVNMSLNTY